MREAQRDGSVAADVDADLAAEHLTALVEGLSERWHSGSTTVERAREILSEAIIRTLGPGER